MADLSSRKTRSGIMSPNHSVLKVLLFSLAGAAVACRSRVAGGGNIHLS